MNTSTLDFITLNVSDVNSTAKLLCRFFNWKILYSDNSLHQNHSIHIGNDKSRLVIESKPDVRNESKNSNTPHNKLFNIGVAVDDISAVEEQVIKAGLQTYSNNVSLNQREFRFNDSDGIEYHIKGNLTDANEMTRRWMKELGEISRFGAMIK